MKIAATVITFNEEANIAEALQSLSWADEIIVVDSQSTDRTVEIARRYTDKIFVRPWPGYAAQKNFAADQAGCDFIFSLDADERVSPELRASIEALKQSDSQKHQAYRIARSSFYLGRRIKHSGWYPDYQVRLYRRDSARWQGDFVHESVKVNGSVGTLPGDLLHYSIKKISEHHQRMDRYTSLAAEEMMARGVEASFARIALSPIATFIRSYLIKQGFRDGLSGLAIAYFAAYYVFLKNIKLWEKQRSLPDKKEG